MFASHTAVPPAARMMERSAVLRDLMLVLLFGALTALSAQIKWLLPGNPVPITGQVFLVLVAGALLGARLGVASQLTYIGFGALGAPVFAGGVSGPAVLLGPTGGYLLGFVLAAGVVGMLTGSRRGVPALTLAMAAGVALIYGCGATWLAVWTHVTRGLPWPEALAQALALGVAPFVIGDVVKIVGAVTAVRGAIKE